MSSRRRQTGAVAVVTVIQDDDHPLLVFWHSLPPHEGMVISVDGQYREAMRQFPAERFPCRSQASNPHGLLEQGFGMSVASQQGYL